ncbi:hypothetical protein EV360DRAFT_82562 [Lentinula raphanica]|nr:hypothetical protein EV360DRAFT_82562 [Lentinula raphanica]
MSATLASRSNKDQCCGTEKTSKDPFWLPLSSWAIWMQKPQWPQSVGGDIKGPIASLRTPFPVSDLDPRLIPSLSDYHCPQPPSTIERMQYTSDTAKSHSNSVMHTPTLAVNMIPRQDLDIDKESMSATEPETESHVRSERNSNPPSSQYPISISTATTSSAIPRSTTISNLNPSLPSSISKHCPVPGLDMSFCRDRGWIMDTDIDMDELPSPTDTEIIEVELTKEEILQDLKARGIKIRDYALMPGKK